MSRYYLHLHEAGERVIDADGIACSTLEAARNAAMHAAREIMAAEVLEGRLTLDGAIEIHDEKGNSLSLVQFCDAVCISGLQATNQSECAIRDGV